MSKEILKTASVAIVKSLNSGGYYLQVIFADTETSTYTPISKAKALQLAESEGLEIQTQDFSSPQTTV